MAAMAGPLAGLRVVELVGLGPGPLAGMLLADMGADVVMVDRPGGSGSTMPPERDVVRRSRRSIIVDLRNPRGAEAVLALAAGSDVLIEGFRPGVTERLGIGPEHCWALNPRLVYGRMTGWGQDGPLAQRAGHDIGYIAVTGALGAMGRAGEAPAVPLNLVGDLGAGSTYLVMGVLAAVIEARSSGRGQVVDAAIVDGTVSLMAELRGRLAEGLICDERGTNLLDTGRPWYDVYATADGGWMAVGAIEARFYAEMMLLLGLDPAESRRQDPQEWPTIRAEIAAAFASRTRADWESVFADTDACVAPVLSMSEAPAHPHLAERRTFDTDAGVSQPAPAPRFSRTPSAISRPPAAAGQHSREILRDWGVADADGLVGSGAVLEPARQRI